jgi:glutamyl-tRNA synthetase
LARLGWSRGEKEVFYMDDLIKDFEITEIQKAGAIFDITKLEYLNTQHLSNLDLNQFINLLIPFLKELKIDIESHSKKDLLITSMRSSAPTLKAIAKNLECYFKDINEYDQKAINKFLGGSSKTLVDLKKRLSKVGDWNESSIDEVLQDYREEEGLKVPMVNQPLRIAITGSTNSPSLGLTLSLFHKDEAIKRIDALIKFVEIDN